MPAPFLSIRRAAGFVDRYHWLVLLLAAPAFLFPSPARAPLLLVLPGLWLTAWLAGRPALPRTPLNAVLLLFSLMLLVSVWTTPDLAYSLPKIAGALLGLGAYFAVVRVATDRPQASAPFWRMAWLFILSGGGLVAIGLVGIDWLDKLPALAAISQKLPVFIRGLPGAEEGFSANGVAGALILILPLQVALLIRTVLDQSPRAHWYQRDFSNSRFWPKLWPWTLFADPFRGGPRLFIALQIFLLLLVSGLVLLSQSRGAWLGLGAGLLLMLAWGERRARWPLLAAAVVGVAALLVLGGPQSLFSLVGRVAGNDIGAKVIQRQTLWYYGLLVIRSFPFTGMGLNAFRKALPELYPTVPLPAGFDITHVHNHLLQAAINFGLPGLVAYLGLWLGAAFALFDAHRASRDPWLRAAALGLSAGLVAEFVYGTTDVIDTGAKLGLFFWLALALSISLYPIVRARAALH